MYLLRLLVLLPLLYVPTDISAKEVPAFEVPAFNGKRRPFTVVVPAYRAPIVSWYTPTNGITNIRRYQGKVILLNFWATWCAACLYEMPDLDRLAKAVEDRDFAVVTVNLDETDSAVIARYFKRLGVSALPQLSDPLSKSIRSYGIREGLPWSFMVDRSGQIRGYMMGAANWLLPAGRALIAYYLNEEDKSHAIR